jgi:hypothetical protein
MKFLPHKNLYMPLFRLILFGCAVLFLSFCFPVVANAFEEERQTAMDVGMNGHLAKPYDIPEIMRTLKEQLN